MSIVSKWESDEAASALKRQRAAATVSSFVISLLVVALVIAVLAVILLPTFRVDSVPIVTYQAPKPPDEKVKGYKKTSRLA